VGGMDLLLFLHQKVRIDEGFVLWQAALCFHVATPNVDTGSTMSNLANQTQDVDTVRIAGYLRISITTRARAHTQWSTPITMASIWFLAGLGLAFGG
jgi:hypothetical protein